jgi:hypothetical protein
MKKEIVFARTRYVYDSYTDFWRLVELSGFPTVYVDEIDRSNPNVTYIVSPFNGEIFPLGEGERRSKVILWNLERPAGSGGIEKYITDLRGHIKQGYMDEVIVSDTTLAKKTEFTYVPLGSHRDLGEPGALKSYAYAHLMCYSTRRSFLFNTPGDIKEVYYGLPIAPNGWGEDRHLALQKSWMMLNVHQDDDPILEPLRFALATAYGLPILSENMVASPFPYHKGTVQFPLAGIDIAMTTAFRKRQDIAVRGLESREFVTKYHTFRGCIERYL